MRALARRYARAAVGASGATTSLQPLADSLAALAAAMAEVPALREAAFNPAFRGSKEMILRAVMEHLGSTPTALILVALMARNSRLPEVGEVALAVAEIADRQAHRLRARLESAVPISDAQAARIAASLSGQLGAQVEIGRQVRPELIGGWVCHIGAITLDASLRRALDNLTERLLFGGRPSKPTPTAQTR